MPQFNPKPNAVSSTIQPLPKDSYEFVIGEPKVFSKKNEATGDLKNYGISFTLTVADGEFAGKKAFPRLFMHSEGAQAFAKQFQIAASNYNVNPVGEKEFDAALGDADWGFNTDTGEVGAAWIALKGQRIKGDLSVSTPTAEYPNPQQVFDKWFPFNPAS